jgi:CheY-like chemotaxis protein
MKPTKILLLVEDEPLIRHLKEALMEAGFDVAEAASGAKALSEFEADASRIRGLITDINLGKGPDGWEIARRGRELIPGPAGGLSQRSRLLRLAVERSAQQRNCEQAVRDGPARHRNFNASGRGRRPSSPRRSSVIVAARCSIAGNEENLAARICSVVPGASHRLAAVRKPDYTDRKRQRPG